MRILLRELSPATTYQIQLRAKGDAGGSVSEWSRVFSLTTTADVIAPNTPTGVTGTQSGSAFQLVWNAVTLSSDGTPAHDLDHYDVKVESTGTGTNAVYSVKGLSFLFDLNMNRQLFGSPRANIRMSVRAVDAVGNASAYSAIQDQTNAAPANPANFTATAALDTILLKWDAVADTDLIYYKVYSGTTSGSQTTLVWQGPGTGATIPSTSYFSDRWYKVAAVDVFLTESVTPPVVGPVRPTSAFTLDSVAPAVPTGLAAVLTTAADTTTSAQVSWTAVPDTDGDLNNYIIDYRPVGASDWQTVNVDYTKTSVKIDRLTPYINYDFRIRSSDFFGNLSAYSSTVTTTTAATNTAPAAVTGLIGVAGASTVTVLWTEASELDVKNGAGMYEVQMATDSGFSANLQTIKTAATVASFRTDGLAAGTRYIRVRAVDSLGLAGAYSTTLTLNQNDVAATEGYAQSRGMNLVTNGLGVLGTNKNFSTFTFDAADRPFGGGSFKTTASGAVQNFNDELIPVDTAKGYVLTAYARQQNPLQLGAAFYAGFSGYDVDGLAINSQMHMFLPNTLTTLATTLNPGATTVTLTSAANWQNAAGFIYDRAFIFWNWTDSKGYTYPPGTYSRNYYYDSTNGMWPAGGISGNVITLTTPWAGPSIPAGTAVSNSTAGGSYKYTTAANVIAPQTWTKYQGRVAGVDLSGQNVTNAFPPGTAYIKLLFLSHYPTLTAGQTSTIAYAGLSVSEVDGGNLLPSTMGGDVVIANTLAGDRVIANSLDANTLKANTSFIQNLNVKSTFTLGDATTLGAMRSYEYLNTAGASGWRITDNSLVIKSGVIEAAALKIQASPNIVPNEYSDFEMGNYFYISAFWNAFGQDGMAQNGCIADAVLTSTPGEVIKGKRYLGVSNPFGTGAASAYFGRSATDYNIDVEPSTRYIISVYLRNRATSADTWNINVKGDNGSQIATQSFALGASEAGYTRRTFAFTTPSSGVSKVLLWLERPGTGFNPSIWVDCLQMEKKTGTDDSPSVWKPPGGTTVDGSGITTGLIRSTGTVTVAGSTLPAWSLNTQGNLQVGDALVRGKLIVGTTGEDYPNRAPGNGDFETNVTGYSVYQVGATGTSIARTTTGGEVISGTGSAKIVAAAGAKTSLGMSFTTPVNYVAGTTVRVRGNVKVNTTDVGSTVSISLWNAASGAVVTAPIVTAPVANTTYSFDYSYQIQTGEDVASVTLYHSGGTATSVIFDDIVLTADVDVATSVVQSANFVTGSTGWRIDGQGNVEMNNGIFRGQLGAGIVTADTLSSTLTISSNFRTADLGKRVEFSGSGIVAYRSDETPRVVIPTDDTTPASFDGDLLASSLTISDQLAIRGINNELSKGSTLTIQSGTTAPSSPPTVVADWKTYPAVTGAGFEPYRYGITVQGGWFRIPLALYGVGTVVESYNMTTGAKQYGSLSTYANDGMWNATGGITSIGNNVYLLGTNKAGDWRIMGYTFGTGVSGTPTRFMNVAFPRDNDQRTPALGTDGTNLVVAFTRASNPNVQYRSYNATTGAFVTSGTSNLAYSGEMASINKGVFDNGFGQAGGTCFVITTKASTTAYVMNNSFQRISGWDFPLASRPSGQTYDSGTGKFYTFDAAGAQITEHTGISWDSTNAAYNTWHAVNTWYNTDATNGNKETVIGPPKPFAMKKRGRVTITSPPIPIRPVPNTVDDATAVGVYLARNSSAPTRTMFERQAYLADGVRTVTYESVTLPVPAAAASFPPPLNSNFPASSPAVLRSDGDRFNLAGDGTGGWGGIIVGASTINVPITSTTNVKMHIQHYTAVTTDASGFTTISHSAGFTPTAAYALNRSPASTFPAQWGADTFTSTQTRLRWFNASAGGVANAISTGPFSVVFYG